MPSCGAEGGLPSGHLYRKGSRRDWLQVPAQEWSWKLRPIVGREQSPSSRFPPRSQTGVGEREAGTATLTTTFYCKEVNMSHAQ